MTARIAAYGVALIIYMGLPPAGLASALLPPAVLPSAGHGLQVLEAADNAELHAEIAADAVNRIALENDRVIRVVQAPNGLRVEHDPVRGDVYLYPDARVTANGESVVLYLGTERGRTYRLSLAVTDRESAQILIRNPYIEAADGAGGPEVEPHADALVELILAMARATPLPGYSIAPAESGIPAERSPAGGSTEGRGPEGDDGMNEFPVLEVWRGSRWTARMVQIPEGGPVDAAAVASLWGGRALAAWLSERGRGPSGERLAVIVEANGSSETDR